jgi:hypothetical protein
VRSRITDKGVREASDEHQLKAWMIGAKGADSAATRALLAALASLPCPGGVSATGAGMTPVEIPQNQAHKRAGSQQVSGFGQNLAPQKSKPKTIQTIRRS